MCASNHFPKKIITPPVCAIDGSIKIPISANQGLGPIKKYDIDAPILPMIINALEHLYRAQSCPHITEQPAYPRAIPMKSKPTVILLSVTPVSSRCGPMNGIPKSMQPQTGSKSIEAIMKRPFVNSFEIYFGSCFGYIIRDLGPNIGYII